MELESEREQRTKKKKLKRAGNYTIEKRIVRCFSRIETKA